MCVGEENLPKPPLSTRNMWTDDQDGVLVTSLNGSGKKGSWDEVARACSCKVKACKNRYTSLHTLPPILPPPSPTLDAGYQTVRVPLWRATLPSDSTPATVTMSPRRAPSPDN